MRLAGIVLGFSSFGVQVAAKRALMEAETPSRPGAPTTILVTSGPYSVSRNPLYAGDVLGMAALALVTDSPWGLGVTVLAALVLDRWLIRPEERYLDFMFGAAYADYRRRVRRWF